MSRESNCRCLICNLERTLIREVEGANLVEPYREFATSRSLLSPFPSAPDLVAFLHNRTTTSEIPSSDRILAELLEAAAMARDSQALRDVALLAFIPMLHATSRSVACRYLSLSAEDVAQHVVLFLLQILNSAEFYSRSSHVAFAISRVLKRQSFEWAARETRSALPSRDDWAVSELPSAHDTSEPLERSVILRHFLHRSYERGLLTGQDLELLVRYKLEAVRDGDPHWPSVLYRNASRQRMKRLLAKLRRIARKPEASPQLRLF